MGYFPVTRKKNMDMENPDTETELSTKDLVTFLRAMQKSNEKITKQMNVNHELLSNEIKDSRNKIQEKLQNITKNLEEVKNENLKTDEKNRRRFARIEERIDVIEKANSENLKRKRTVPDLPTNGKTTKNCNKPEDEEDNLTDLMRKVKMDEKRKLEDTRKQEKAAETEATRRSEKEKDKEKFKPVKLGDSQDLHDQEDWGWDESEDQWDNTVERREKNNEKKLKAKKHKMEIEKCVTEKARYIIGIGPVYMRLIEHFHRIVGDYDDAKKMAAQEYLTVHLRFDDKEVAEMEISDTQVSSKGENILYVVMTDESHIHDIRGRMAMCRDPDLQLQDFIPPQYFKRYIALSKFAQELRLKDKDTKTQIRYGKCDVELWTKNRSQDERFSQMNMDDIEREQRLPKFDHTIRWTRKKERPPRRQISPTKIRAEVPSLRQNQEEFPSTGRVGSENQPTSASKKVRRSDSQNSMGKTNTDVDADMEEIDEQI